VTRGQLPQRAGSLGLNGRGAAAAVPPTNKYGENYSIRNEKRYLHSTINYSITYKNAQ